MQNFFSQLKDRFLTSRIWQQWAILSAMAILLVGLLTIYLMCTFTSVKLTFESLLSIFLILILVSFVVAYAVTWIFLGPIFDIKLTLEEVNTKNIADMRIIIKKNRNELTDIANDINRLLDKMLDFLDQQVHFVEDASHELRTPVAIVQGHLQMLERWGKRDPEVLEESITSALSEIARMKTLVQEMLDLQRAGQIEIHAEDSRVEVLSVASAVYENFKMLYPDFRFFLDEDLAKNYYVSMKKDHLEQCLIILMDNAVKYSTDRPEVHLSLSSDDVKYLEIAVQDFGEGMSSEDQAKIFNRFYRVDKARSRERGGNGLGLSIAKQLIDSYKGQIFVDSSLGGGSIFHVRLPIIDTETRIRKARPLPPSEELQRHLEMKRNRERAKQKGS